MDQLAEIIKSTVVGYRADGDALKMFALSDEERQVWAVTVVDSPQVKIPAGIVVQARLVGDKVVIDADNTDRPLYQALLEKGIPREQIVLAYVGESPPMEAV